MINGELIVDNFAGDAGEYLGHKPQGVTARHYAFRSEDHTVKIFESYVAAV